MSIPTHSTPQSAPLASTAVPTPSPSMKIYPPASSHYALPVPAIVGIVAAGVVLFTALTMITVLIVCIKHRREKRAKAEKLIQNKQPTLPEMVVVQPGDVTEAVLEAGEGGADKVIHLPVNAKGLKTGNRMPSPMVLERVDPQDAMRDERGFLRNYDYWKTEL